MDTIIDLHSEVLIDRSRIHNPYVRLLLSALGQELAKGSAWIALNKNVASQYALRMPGSTGWPAARHNADGVQRLRR